ncbi:hypothetical protein C8F04DRAFT_418542 [Mycena alexandri]|uniref:CxC2-like cysteine cluster KDZ transposase-associated domain-containing protein n=1 Tax=Mycena alexandri TaxID=1745969 RepID=A0AAD6WNH3_9AGAR|nr:hypothetical protein C8F04DRAFT_418542 [Mycena alexandri]
MGRDVLHVYNTSRFGVSCQLQPRQLPTAARRKQQVCRARYGLYSRCCEKAAGFGHPRKQLLCRGWYPATHGIPKSGATLRGLEFFIVLTLQAKTTVYDYYTTLEKTTDPTGNYRPPY